MLDNVYELSQFPLKAQATAAHATRRIGLGITGFADAFVMLGVRYGADNSLDIADSVMRTVSHAAVLSRCLARDGVVHSEHDPRLCWTDLSCQRIELFGECHGSAAIMSELALANHVHELDAGEHIAG